MGCVLLLVLTVVTGEEVVMLLLKWRTCTAAIFLRRASCVACLCRADSAYQVACALMKKDDFLDVFHVFSTSKGQSLLSVKPRRVSFVDLHPPPFSADKELHRSLKSTAVETKYSSTISATVGRRPSSAARGLIPECPRSFPRNTPSST